MRLIRCLSMISHNAAQLYIGHFCQQKSIEIIEGTFSNFSMKTFYGYHIYPEYWDTATINHTIATDKAFFFIRKMLISFLFRNKNISCGYSLEAPWKMLISFLFPNKNICCGYLLEAPR